MATRTMCTKIGIINRKNYSIAIVLKSDSLMLSAGGRTGKDYKQSEIVSVAGLSLNKAVSAGICSIIR